MLEQIIQGATQMHAWEAVAVILSLAYLLFAMKESLWCWYCAFFSTLIYTILFWKVNLLMDSALQVYYLLMAIYGWQQWRQHNNGSKKNTIEINRWPLQNHLMAIAGVLIVSSLSGYYLDNHTQAAWPYVDSFTTWASVLTTYMVAKKVLENWLYWIVIDSVACLVYIDRGLYFTALLFAAYVVIVVFGFFSWRRDMQHERYATA